MFTGLVQCKGSVLSLEGGRLLVDPGEGWPNDPLMEGESISVNGCCLTLVQGDGGMNFDLSEETMVRTSLGRLAAGHPVNLERALRAGDRLGGHIVQGHVDGLGTCLSVTENPGSWTVRFAVPGGGKYLIDKGSICLDGVSLTVVAPEGDEFEVAVIPHTFAVTTLGSIQADQPVNVEFDVLAKHVEKLLAYQQGRV